MARVAGGVGRHLRDSAHVESDRRQDRALAGARAQPQLVRRVAAHLAWADHASAAACAQNVQRRIRFSRSPAPHRRSRRRPSLVATRATNGGGVLSRGDDHSGRNGATGAYLADAGRDSHPIRFTDDTVHKSYDRDYVSAFWHILVNCERIFSRARCCFLGKASPVHFFWGSFDLAVTRFSGRPAPPREGPEFMREAYSHEVISHGFWPGGGAGTAFGPGPVNEPAFYAYAVPEPSGFKTSDVEPSGAFYHAELGEFILPYRIVQSANDSDATLRSFLDSTYSRAADLASWDRAALERPVLE